MTAWIKSCLRQPFLYYPFELALPTLNILSLGAPVRDTLIFIFGDYIEQYEY